MNKYPRVFLAIAVVLLVFLLILYNKMETIPETPKRLKIQVVTDSIQHKLTPYPHQRNIYGLHLEISGYLEGSASMCFGKENSKYHETIFIETGQIDHQITLDWKTTDCKMYYNPISVKNGDIQISYRFFSSK